MKDNELDAPADTEEKTAAPPPHALKRIRVCGKFQKPGYKPSKKEREDWIERCEQTGLDPATGEKVATEKKAEKAKK